MARPGDRRGRGLAARAEGSAARGARGWRARGARSRPTSGRSARRVDPSSRPRREHRCASAAGSSCSPSTARAGRPTRSVPTGGQDALVEELGLEPGPELQRLEKAILVQDASLDLPPAASPPSTNGAGPVRGRSGRHGRPRRAIAVAGVASSSSSARPRAPSYAALFGRAAAARRTCPMPNTVAAIDPAVGRRQRSGRGGRRAPRRASPSAPGAVWVANVDDQTLSRIDPATMQTSPERFRSERVSERCGGRPGRGLGCERAPRPARPGQGRGRSEPAGLGGSRPPWAGVRAAGRGRATRSARAASGSRAATT